MKYLVFPFILIFVIIQWGFVSKNESLEDQSVSSVLEALGDYSLDSNKYDASIPWVSEVIGRDIVLRGSSNRKDFKNSSRQSKHFVCTSCHNIEREDPDLKVSDPEARLIYTAEKGIPFLQGTSLYGVVNRVSFYEDDYYKKYGELVTKAQSDIREAIQLCATECSQGRRLQDWELESVLAFLWVLELKFTDLEFSASEILQIEKSLETGNQRGKSIDLIKSKYLAGSPAHFVEKPENIAEGYPYEGNPDNGKLIYENSCYHCHFKKKYSFFNLDDSKMTFNYLKKKAGKYSNHSIYQVVRYGTSPKYGKKSYMPHYPKEKMSNKQVEDLRAYIEMRAR